MSTPLDYTERLALKQAQARERQAYGQTAPGKTLVQNSAQVFEPVEKQAPTPTEKPSPTWQRLLTEAQVKFSTGLAPSMHEALGVVAKEQPALYEQYRQEQLAQCGAPVAKAVQVREAQEDPSVVQFAKQVAALEAQGLPHHEALAKALASPEGLKRRQAYYAAHPQHGVRR
jgi:hypothetical protein